MTDIPERLPEGYELYARTADFTPDTLPDKLKSAHTTKAGVWGLLRVTEGAVHFELEAPRHGQIVARAGDSVVIETGVPHHVAFIEAGRFHVEFYRAS